MPFAHRILVGRPNKTRQGVEYQDVQEIGTNLVHNYRRRGFEPLPDEDADAFRTKRRDEALARQERRGMKKASGKKKASSKKASKKKGSKPAGDAGADGKPPGETS